MTHSHLFRAGLLGLALLAASPSLAAERGNSDRGRGERPAAGSSLSVTLQIGERDRAVIRDYYRTSMSSGKCPPGLAKKNNGCMPPGQAKKWARGQRLPQDVVFHDLPSDLRARVEIPVGYRLVQVASDILLIAAGTGMVVDAVEDLGRL
jgi:Ni/Co efflux regulator RcnB